MKLPLSIAFAANPRTWPIMDGSARADGIELIPNIVHPSELFWRQLKFADWDVAEMSFSSLMIAHARGDDRFVGLTGAQIVHEILREQKVELVVGYPCVLLMRPRKPRDACAPRALFGHS